MKKYKVKVNLILLVLLAFLGILSSLISIGLVLGKYDNVAAPNANDFQPPIVYVVVEKSDYEELQLPQTNLSNSFKTYMDYNKITNTSTKQWQLQQNATTNEQGLRTLDSLYMIAIGSDYANVGDIIKVTLDSGIQFECIVGDIKNANDSNATGQYHYAGDGINIIEFIVDTNTLHDLTKVMGDISYIEGFSGHITKLEKKKGD